MTAHDKHLLSSARGYLRRAANKAKTPEVARILRQEAARLVEWESREITGKYGVPTLPPQPNTL